MAMRHTCLTLTAAFAILLAALMPAKHFAAADTYTTPFPAFPITENLYYVGSKESARTMRVKEDSKTRNVVIIGSPNVKQKVTQ